MFVEADFMAWYLILYTCDNGTENTWIQRLGDVSQILSPPHIMQLKPAFFLIASSGGLVQLYLIYDLSNTPPISQWSRHQF